MDTKLAEKIAVLAESQDRSQKIYQPVDGWVLEYKDIEAFADQQMHTFWPFTEYDMQNDVPDLRQNCTEAERLAIIEILRLFTHYELAVGEDYWARRYSRIFPRPEFQRAASMFFAVELNSHAPFYNEANKVLYIDTPEFYAEWKQDPVLVERMNFIEQVASAKDDLVSIAGFVFIEGVVLYSSFAFLKHFQAQEAGAKNLMTTLNRGINQSVTDENLHAMCGAATFRHLLAERQLDDSQKSVLMQIIDDLSLKVFEHESAIIDKLFSNGEIHGISAGQMKDFIKHRINFCRGLITLNPYFDEEESDKTIENWFYRDINSINFHDFFSGSGSEYHVKWSKDKFANAWKK